MGIWARVLTEALTLRDLAGYIGLGQHNSISTKYLDHSPSHTTTAIVESYSYRSVSAMASPDVHHLFHHPIADHSFSADRQTLAVARDNNVELYSRSGNKFTLQDELKGHDKTVTSVDIAPSTGRIVTCSQGVPREEVKGTREKADFKTRRSQCIRLGTVPFRLEAYARTTPHQPCSNICTVVSVREKICRWLWCPGHCSLLF